MWRLSFEGFHKLQAHMQERDASMSAGQAPAANAPQRRAPMPVNRAVKRSGQFGMETPVDAARGR